MARNRWGVLLLVALVATVGIACSGGDDAEGGGGEADMGVTAADEGGGSAVPPGAPRAQRAVQDLPSIGPAVIKTANLSVEVAHDRFQEAFGTVVSLAQEKGGYVLSSNAGGEDSHSGSITLRVPQEVFEATVTAISDLGEVKSESESGEDVSEEFVDLQARIRHLSAQEAVMLRLMDRAKSIRGTIRVQNELTGIQLEIERLRGRLRYLEDQTTFGTISVHLTEAGVVAPREPSTIERAWEVARETTGAIVSGLLIGGAAIVPVALVLLLALLIFRWVRPRTRPFFGDGGP